MKKLMILVLTSALLLCGCSTKNKKKETKEEKIAEQTEVTSNDKVDESTEENSNSTKETTEETSDNTKEDNNQTKEPVQYQNESNDTSNVSSQSQTTVVVDQNSLIDIINNAYRKTTSQDYTKIMNADKSNGLFMYDTFFAVEYYYFVGDGWGKQICFDWYYTNNQITQFIETCAPLELEKYSYFPEWYYCDESRNFVITDSTIQEPDNYTGGMSGIVEIKMPGDYLINSNDYTTPTVSEENGNTVYTFNNFGIYSITIDENGYVVSETTDTSEILYIQGAPDFTATYQIVKNSVGNDINENEYLNNLVKQYKKTN